MMFMALKVIISTSVIIFASWLAGKKPELAGFITALPLVSIIAIALSYWQNHDPAASSQYAKSIILAVPVSWLFFVPFFFTEKLGINFWSAWAAGLVLLAAGYFIHQGIMKLT
jgi:hypothetical protein